MNDKKYQGEKSHVSMEQRMCPVCTKCEDTGSILLDQRLQKSMYDRTVTGWGMCAMHQKLTNDGFVHLVVTKGETHNRMVAPEDANRTGELLTLRREAFQNLFDTDIVGDDVSKAEMVFIDEAVAEKIKEIYRRDTGVEPVIKDMEEQRAEFNAGATMEISV